MEITLALLILVAIVVLFVTESYPPDFVAMLGLGGILLIGLAGTSAGLINPERWISVSDAFSGFANPAVVTVAAMFVLSAGLQRTGAMGAVTRVFTRIGKHPTILLIAMMLTIAPVSAFVNNTAAVAVFLPIIFSVCARASLPTSKYLIPLSYASQFGGVCTLIGTSTNLLVSSISERAGYGAFGMFEFTAPGMVMTGAGILFILIAGPWLLPARPSRELLETYQLREYVAELRVMDQSPLIGRTVIESNLGVRHDVIVLELLRNRRKIWSPTHEPLAAGDVLLVCGRVNNLMELKSSAGLEIEPEFRLKRDTLEQEEMVLVEALVAPRSDLVGRTMAQTAFRHRYGAVVLALQRQGHLFRDRLSKTPLQIGDALLLLVRKQDIAEIRGNNDLIVLGQIDTPPVWSRRAVMALGILAGVILLASFKVMPIVVSALLGSIALVLTRCLRVEEAYEAVDWKVIFLLAAILPVGLVLERSGAAQWIAGGALGLGGQFGPFVVLAVIYLATAVLTEFMSNAAAALLLAPIAIYSAVQLGVSPKPFLFAVAFAASTSFATPVGYQTNTMVYNVGGYRFVDFLKIGIPLNLIFWALAVWLIPKFWPF